MTHHEVLAGLKGWLLPGLALLMLSGGLLLFLPYPRFLLYIGNLHYYVIAAAVTLATVAILLRSRGLFRIMGGASMFLAALELAFFLAWSQELRNLHRVHAVARKACRGMPISDKSNDEALRRALTLAGLPPEAARGLLLSCREDGPETSTSDGFDKGWTLHAHEERLTF